MLSMPGVNESLRTRRTGDRICHYYSIVPLTRGESRQLPETAEERSGITSAAAPPDCSPSAWTGPEPRAADAEPAGEGGMGASGPGKPPGLGLRPRGRPPAG